jgi:hypothetical protein
MTQQNLVILYQIDLIVRGGSLTLLALWSYVIFRDHRAILSARIAIILNITIAAYIVNGVLYSLAANAAVNEIFDALSVFAPPLLWLFALTWFNDIERIGLVRWLIVFALGIPYFAQAALIAVTGEPLVEIWLVMRIAMFGFGAAGIWAAWQGRENDLVEARRRFRLLLIAVIGGFVILVNAVELMVLSDVFEEYARALIELAIFLITFVISAKLYNLANPELFAHVKKLSPTLAEPDDRVHDLRTHLPHRRPNHCFASSTNRRTGISLAPLNQWRAWLS